MATAVQVEALWNGLTDNSGDLLGAGKVYTYAAGTTTPVSLFTASDKTSSATNPIILDGYGRAQVWADGRYKFVVKTSADVTLYTLDNLLYGFDDSQLLWGGLSTGSANAQAVSTIATTTAYSNGLRLSFIAGYTNTGATTVKINSLSTVSIVKGPSASSLQAGDIVAGQLVNCTYYGGSFRLEDYPTLGDLSQSRTSYATAVAGTNTITGTLAPAPYQYEAGMRVVLKAAATNTGAATLNLNGLGAKTIQRYGTALVGGEIKANDMVELFYDGTQFQLVGAPPDPIFLDRVNSRVGVGTTAPTQKLSVEGNITAGSTTTAAGYSLAITTGSANYTRIARYSGADATGEIRHQGNGGFQNVLEGTGTWSVSLNASNRLVVDTAGVVTTSGQLQSAGGSVSAPTYSFSSDTNTGVYRIGADVLGIATGGVEVLRADASQNVGIGASPAASTTRLTVRGGGTTTNNAFVIQDSAGTNTFRVYDNGHIVCPDTYNTTTGNAANINVDSVGNFQRSTSSIRYKTDVQDATHGLAEVLQLRPVTYKGINDGDTVFGGLIAEEVDAAGLSEFVMYNEAGQPDALAYGNMVSLLAKAIQQLNAKVESLEAQLATQVVS